MKLLRRGAHALPFVAIVVAGLAAADAPAIQRYPATGSIEIAFTPDDRIDRLIVGAIDTARHEVLVQAYSFTDHSIARALVRARKRGVDVRVVADREQARSLPQNVLPELVAGGVGVWLDGNFQAAHSKVIIIDADAPHATTITGSYNFTIAAQRGNAENVIVLRDNAPIARGYRDNWLRRKADAAVWSDDALRQAVELAVWINDPENGQGNLTSALNLGIWKAFAKHGIKTSYPQREVRVLATAPGTTPQADPKTQI